MNALAKIHIAKKQLGLDDETYRDMLQRETGKRSTKDMTTAERERIVAVLVRSGFKPSLKAPGTGMKQSLSGPYAKLLQALWIGGWNLGLIIDRKDAALLTFVERQTGIQRTEFLRGAADARKAVEALKQWLAREGGVDWSEATGRAEHTQRNGFRIAAAQWAKLHPEGTGTFWAEVSRILDRSVVTLKPSDAEWIKVMNALGKKIRDTRGVRRAAA